jgi:hypothetical protein
LEVSPAIRGESQFDAGSTPQQLWQDATHSSRVISAMFVGRSGSWFSGSPIIRSRPGVWLFLEFKAKGCLAVP